MELGQILLTIMLAIVGFSILIVAIFKLKAKSKERVGICIKIQVFLAIIFILIALVYFINY